MTVGRPGVARRGRRERRIRWITVCDSDVVPDLHVSLTDVVAPYRVKNKSTCSPSRLASHQPSGL